MSSLGRRRWCRPVRPLRAERTMAADPLGVALLLGGPAAGQLWSAASLVQPYGRTRRGRGRDHVDGGRRAAFVEVGSSVRSGSAVVLPVTITVSGGPPIAGSLRLTPMGAVYAAPATRATLTLEYGGQPPRRLRRLVEQYLTNLAAAVQP